MPTFPPSTTLRMTLDHGLAWTDHECRRGEMIVWPEWQEKPARTSADYARIIINMMTE